MAVFRVERYLETRLNPVGDRNPNNLEREIGYFGALFSRPEALDPYGVEPFRALRQRNRRGRYPKGEPR
jgi:hypothetical protein